MAKFYRWFWPSHLGYVAKLILHNAFLSATSFFPLFTVSSSKSHKTRFPLQSVCFRCGHVGCECVSDSCLQRDQQRRHVRVRHLLALVRLHGVLRPAIPGHRHLLHRQRWRRQWRQKFKIGHVHSQSDLLANKLHMKELFEFEHFRYSEKYLGY